VDVYVGSLPVVLNGQNRGLAVTQKTVNGQTTTALTIQADGSVLQPTSGQLAAEVSSCNGDLSNAINDVNNFASDLINQVNKVYSQGQGLQGFTSVTSDNAVTDPTKALNDPASGLAFPPTNGSFQVTVTQQSTGQSVTTTVPVVLDGINPSSQTTLNSLAADLNGIANISASVTPDGRLQMASASSDYQITFSKDTSGALAALGINDFFTGSNATNIGVAQTVSGNLNLLAAAQNNQPGDNSNALALANLQNQSLSDLGGASLTDVWQSHVENYASLTAQAQDQVTATGVVQSNLSAQQQSVSGVNEDQEAINLMTYQRAYEASAQFLTVVNDMTKTLLALV
jgi:flagellar hook-associated protein 1 FlgK